MDIVWPLVSLTCLPRTFFSKDFLPPNFAECHPSAEDGRESCSSKWSFLIFTNFFFVGVPASFFNFFAMRLVFDLKMACDW